MTPMRRIYRKNLEHTPSDQISLSSLLNELEEQGWHRMPIFVGEDHAKYIMHVSMIDKFIRKKIFAGESVETVAGLTLAHLLDEPSMKNMFETTFAVVGEDATVEGARRAMEAGKQCQDVFITKNGTAEEPVIGWLTDRDLIDL